MKRYNIKSTILYDVSRFEGPAAPEKSELISDTQTGDTLLRLKLDIRGEKQPVSVSLGVRCFDIHGGPLGDTGTLTMDLAGKADERVPLWENMVARLPEPATARVDISVLEVVFEDGTVWKAGEVPKTFPHDEKAGSPDEPPQTQYYEESYTGVHDTEHHAEEERPGEDRPDENVREPSQRGKYEAQQKKGDILGFLKKKGPLRSGLIAAISAAVLCCVAMFIFIIPYIRYNSAVNLYEKGRYEDTYEIFSRISYADSAEKALVCKYDYGTELIKDREVNL